MNAKVVHFDNLTDVERLLGYCEELVVFVFDDFYGDIDKRQLKVIMTHSNFSLTGDYIDIREV